MVGRRQVTGPTGAPPRHRRSWWCGVLAAALIAVGTAAPAQAHAGIVLTVIDDGRGSVSVDLLWADGHPVTGPVAGTLVAVSAAGAQVGPSALARLEGTSTAVYEGTLPDGDWQVTIDVAAPGIGHCAAPVAVQRAGPGRPGSTRCGEPKPAAAAPVAQQRPAGGRSYLPLVAAAGVILLGMAVAVGLRRRRSGRS
ncbi:hypothetical protein COUCH_26630 [Couchioplanes caeruleus]|uniref:hypothetical protein n=1 Tax=Couchioplanes caeruleus TaxID=56438 RepID=UPI0020BE54C9|nr:hypothetical protein [Couchioplanes caeruleus]UQU62591.1 hypothetical protein COUCH_26630 [Couchioplanes caeruleus]